MNLFEQCCSLVRARLWALPSPSIIPSDFFLVGTCRDGFDKYGFDREGYDK